MHWSPALLSVLSLVVAATAQAQPGPAAPLPAAAPPAAPAAPPPGTATPASPSAAASPAAAPPATYSAELAQTPASASSAEATGSDDQVGARDAHVGLFVNALGVLQFGLSPTVEYGSRVAVNARVLLLNTGVLSYVEAGNDTLHFSVAAGPGVRYYFGSDGNLRGGYLGGLALYGTWEEQDDNSYRYDSSHLIVGVEGGYRWVFHSGFLLGAGAVAGYDIVTGKSATTLQPDLMPDTNNTKSGPFGMLTLDLGFLI